MYRYHVRSTWQRVHERSRAPRTLYNRETLSMGTPLFTAMVRMRMGRCPEPLFHSRESVLGGWTFGATKDISHR